MQVVAAPTGSGKTGILELAILRMLSRALQGEQWPRHSNGQLRAIYLAPSKALVQVSLTPSSRPALPHDQRLAATRLLPTMHIITLTCSWIFLWLQEKVKEWQQRLGGGLNLQIEELTGDSESTQDVSRMESADVICTTPEKFGVEPMHACICVST